MEHHQLLYLSRAQVEEIALGLPAMINLLETVFIEKAHGRTEMPPKPGIHTRQDAFLHAMMAHIPALNAAGIKWVGGYPANKEKGLPYISGILILNDDETGFPIAVMDSTWITAYRTGAATALSAKYLARPESKIAGILACGVQGRTNLEALNCLFPLERAYAYDVIPEVQAKFVTEMSKKLGLEIVGVDDPKQAVINSDLVVTSSPIYRIPRPVIQKDWLQKGAFASAVDFDTYWTTEALNQLDKLYTDDLPQMAYYASIGYFIDLPKPYAELGEIVAGSKPGRQHADERIMAMNLGLALEDMAVARQIYLEALNKHIGTWLPL